MRELGYKRVLFLVHRGQLARQTKKSYQKIYDSFLNVVKHTCPGVVSCVIQINESDEFVSDSPYLHVFDRLEEIHQQMESDKLSDTMKSIGYEKIREKEYALPNGKKFVRLDYNSAI